MTEEREKKEILKRRGDGRRREGEREGGESKENRHLNSQTVDGEFKVDFSLLFDKFNDPTCVPDSLAI